MSVEEEVELKDLVAQTLETNSCLAKIRAQLRASIFLALDEDVKLSKQQPLLNHKVKTHLETEEGKAMFCIVREFLEFFDLYFTISVFEPESYLGRVYQYEGREKTAKDLGLDMLDDTTVPLLLQLIRFAQTKTKNIDIDLNFNSNGIDDNKSLSQEIDTTSNFKKTDSNNVTSNTRINGIEKSSEDKIFVDNNNLDPEKLNATYDLNSPIISLNFPKKLESDIKNQLVDDQNSIKQQLLDITYSKKEGKDDDTYEDTSSIAEDSVAPINLDSTRVIEVIVNGVGDKLEVPTSGSKIPQPVTKETKILDKPKLSSQKLEKMKPKSSLNSLADLPPIQMNKPRVNDILPSLGTKECKNKSNLHELDKLFDMEVEYEEDFMCSGEDLSLKSDCLKSSHSKINLLDDLEQTKLSADKTAVLNKNKVSNRVISDYNKPLSKSLVNSHKSNDLVKYNDTSSRSETGSSNSSVSEHLEVATLD